MIYAVVFIFGLLVGSFLNVCIVRLPRDRSIVNPPSHCPRCKSSIKFYDNIPIVSFLLLRGKCRSCGEPISWRYPFVELANGLFYVWIVSEFGIGGEAFLVMAFCSSLIVITFIDFDFQIIPDVITFPGMLLGVMIGPFFMSTLNVPLPFNLGHFMPHAWPLLVNFLNSVIGLLGGALPLLAIGWIWEKLRHVEAMGGAVAAIEQSYMKRKLVESNSGRLAAIESGAQKVVGVNCFTESAPSPLTAGADGFVEDGLWTGIGRARSGAGAAGSSPRVPAPRTRSAGPATRSPPG